MLPYGRFSIPLCTGSKQKITQNSEILSYAFLIATDLAFRFRKIPLMRKKVLCNRPINYQEIHGRYDNNSFIKLKPRNKLLCTSTLC